MAKLSTTSIFGDLLVDGMIHGNVTGNLTGNASTATTATTATTAGKWSTARTITIGSKGKSVDGSANVSWSLAEIGAAAASHTHTIANITDLRIKNGAATGITIADPYQSWAHNDIKNNDIIFGGSYNGHTTTDANIVFASGGGKINVVIDGEYYAAEGKQRVYHTGHKPSPSDIGAAASSHGTHVTYSTTAPLVAGTAAVGSANNVARGDHVHPAQTSVSGNAGTATKLATARTIQIGNKSNTFDGSANITYTLADIGAAATSHTHTQINSRGNVTCETTTTRPAVNGLSMGCVYNNGYPVAYGNVLTMKGSGDSQLLIGWSGTSGADEKAYIRSKRDVADANWSNWAQIYTTAHKPTYSDVGAAAASHGTHVTYATATPKANGTAAIGSVNRVAREDHVHPLQTSVATLTTARTLTIGSTGKSFDGSANVSWSLSEIGAAASSHNHSHINRTMTTTPIYNPEQGVLVDFNINEKSGAMVILKLYGNSYSTSPPIEAIYQFYDYSGGSFYNPTGSAISGPPITLKIYRIGGKLKAWFKQPSSYCTFKLDVTYGNNSSTPNVTLSNAAEPTGATETITIAPNRVYSAAYKPTAADLGIGSSISAVASNLSGVTINGYDSMMTTINSNLGNL